MSVRSLRLGLRRLFRKDRVERELADEITHYVEMTAGEYMRQGYPRDEAERKARASVGGVESLKETVRSAGWDATVETIFKDLRYSARALRRQPTSNRETRDSIHSAHCRATRSGDGGRLVSGLD
jgi:hypothetical protein